MVLRVQIPCMFGVFARLLFSLVFFGAVFRWHEAFLEAVFFFVHDFWRLMGAPFRTFWLQCFPSLWLRAPF